MTEFATALQAFQHFHQAVQFAKDVYSLYKLIRQIQDEMKSAPSLHVRPTVNLAKTRGGRKQFRRRQIKRRSG